MRKATIKKKIQDQMAVQNSSRNHSEDAVHRTRETERTERTRHGVLALTVLLFMTVNHPFIAYPVSVNGFFYHMSEYLEWKSKGCLKCIDIVCNCLIGIFVNIFTKWQPYTICASLFSLFAWQCNRNLPIPSCLIHFLFVQIPLLVAVHQY